MSIDWRPAEWTDHMLNSVTYLLDKPICRHTVQCAALSRCSSVLISCHRVHWRFITRRESRSEPTGEDDLPNKPVIHPEHGPEAIHIPPAPDAGASTPPAALLCRLRCALNSSG